MHGENPNNTPESGRAIHQLCDAIKNMQSSVNDAVHHIRQNKKPPTAGVYRTIQSHRQHVLNLLEIAFEEHEDEDKSILTLARNKTRDCLDTYDYYAAIATIFEYEDILEYLENEIETLTPVSSLFIDTAIYWWRIRSLKKQFSYQILALIAKIGEILEDSHSSGLSAAERNMWENKWKEYADKAGASGIHLPCTTD